MFYFFKNPTSLIGGGVFFNKILRNLFLLYMIVLQESASPQTLKFIPRTYVVGSATVRIYDEMRNTSTDYSVTLATVDYYSSCSKIFALKEDNSYYLEVLNGTDIIYTDKIYCTNQTVADYSINDVEYTKNTTTNEFIIRDD